MGKHFKDKELEREWEKYEKYKETFDGRILPFSEWRRKNSKLEKKIDGIIEMDVFTDEKGIYLAYCNLPYHPGLIKAGRAEICQQRVCEHYKRLYL